jgi:23S rRNA pseudouridine2605 synthase
MFAADELDPESACADARMRLARYLAHAGVASRRAAEALIADGHVTVAGAVVTDPARDVDDDSGVAVDGRPLAGPEERVSYALHKPVGVVSTARDTHGRKTVLDVLGVSSRSGAAGPRLYPVGRLDVDSSGLILLTNDGDLANRLTHPRYEVPKTYAVRVAAAPLRESALRALRTGVELDDGPTAPAKVRLIAPDTLEITIHEGRNRQVRRMCDAVGHRALELQRIGFGPLRLDGLEQGRHRRLTTTEVERLRRLAL